MTGSEVPARDLPEEAATGGRRLRSDAQANRRRILDAAEEVFAKDGLSVPVDVVAERAGVGVGTLYRHFPTKEALFEAIVLTKLDDLIHSADIERGDEPTEAFFSFLLQMGDQVALKHDLFDALAAAGMDLKSKCADRVQALEQSLDQLRRQAVACGGVRDDVTTEQIIGLVIGACRGIERTGTTPREPRQMVGIICDGLRASRETSGS